MGLGTNHVTLVEVTNSSRTRSNSAFVRELWADEVIAANKANLVMSPLCVVMNHNKKKGDTFHVPNPTRGDASSKAAETQVTLIANNESKKQYIIDQHWEYSRLIEDIVAIQADDSVRSFYTDDAGYALAKRVDTFLHSQGAKLAGAHSSPLVEGSAYSKAVIGTPSAGALVTWNPSANANAGNAAALNDEGIRLLIRELDDNDTPMAGRVLVIPPVEKKNLLGVTRFTEQAFVGEQGAGNSIRNGRVGNVYGVEVYVSTNCASVADAGAATDQRACLMFQKEAFVFIEQLRPRVQTAPVLEYLSDLFVADTIFGGGVLRPEAGVAIIVPA
jgi:N4-gp56 family major capsid protein